MISGKVFDLKERKKERKTERKKEKADKKVFVASLRDFYINFKQKVNN